MVPVYELLRCCHANESIVEELSKIIGTLAILKIRVGLKE